MEPLLGLLAEYDSTFLAKEVKQSLESPESWEAMVRWKQEFLGSETLLSPEEAALFASLEADGTARQISLNNDLSLAQPVVEQDMRDALRALETSNLAIEKQKNELRVQRHALLEFQQRDQEAEEQRDRLQTQHRRIRSQAKQNIHSANEELEQVLSNGLVASQRQAQYIEDTIAGISAELLKADNQTFSSINRAASTIKTTVYGENLVSKVQTLCDRLILSLSEDIRCRLDRIYLETLMSPDLESFSDQTETNLHSSLDVELDSLHTEVEHLNRVLVTQEFQQPLLTALDVGKLLERQTALSALEYAERCIEYILGKARMQLMRYEHHSSHVLLTNAMCEEALACLDLNFGMLASSSGARNLSTPETHTGSSEPDSLTGEISESINAPHLHARRQLLRTLGASTLTNDDIHNVQDGLESTIRAARSKARETAEAVHSSIISSLAIAFCDFHSTKQALLDALMADTAHQTVFTGDQELSLRKVNLESLDGRLGSGLAKLDLEAVHQPNKDRAAIVNRWGTR